ncbi:MAG: T9SS type A sorting domain-containing protein [Sphingobacteriaceae bacterium]|nr:T9SS type A sorting domain-containing protein [Sphingobacteriaceae bacterium]
MWNGKNCYNPSSTQINEATVLESDINIYPNPNNGAFKIDISFKAENIIIYNSIGQIIQSKKVIDERSFDFEIKENGIYFIQIATENKRWLTKK